MNKTKVTYMDVDSLIPYANNPRLNDNAVDAVAASIKEFGFKVPIFHQGLSRKAMNVWFLKTDRPFRFVGRVNEDTNTYVMLGNQGKLFFTVTNTQITQAQTQKNAEGMTTLYLDYGTYVKSFYSVIVAPQAVRVAEMGAHHRRMHHRVDWNRCVPKIISDRYRKRR